MWFPGEDFGGSRRGRFLGAVNPEGLDSTTHQAYSCQWLCTMEAAVLHVEKYLVKDASPLHHTK